jgi:hypothetical protein
MFPKRRAFAHQNSINIYNVYRISQMKKFHFISHRALVMVFFIFLQQTVSNAQSILAMLGTSTNTIVSVNLLTCEQTPVAPGLSMRIGDFWMMPDGTIYISGGMPDPPYHSQIFRYDPVTSTTTLLLTIPLAGSGGLYGLSDSTLLWHQNDNFYIYNINQNTVTLIGSQSGFNGFSEIFEYNGNLYINYQSGIIYQITLAPTFSVQQTSLFPSPSGLLVGVCNKLFGPVPGSELFGELDLSTGSYNALCYGDLVNSGFYSFAPDPMNTSGPLCDCTSESGTFSGPILLNSCSLDPIPLPHNGDENLDGNDSLVFVVFNYNYINYPDVTYDILHTYTEPEATFIPTFMQTGVYYYIMAVAANEQSGTVDITEPCADFSDDIVVVRWAQSPTVSFNGTSVICGSGSCQTIGATFTGSPPFSLTYKVSAASNTQTFTQIFNSVTGSIQVCAPAGYSGFLTVEATNLSDAICVCGN